jgi:hypothetical protein
VSDNEINTNEQVVQPPPKALLRLVYIMGIVLVLLFLGFIAAVIWKGKAPKKPVSVGTPEMELPLNGSKVISSALQDGQLLITTENELIVVDVARKTILLKVKTK